MKHNVLSNFGVNLTKKNIAYKKYNINKYKKQFFFQLIKKNI